MYNNPYMNYQQNFSQQSLNDRIDTQIAQLQQMKEQFKNNQQPAINQTFQLAPNGTNTMRYANTIDDVNKEIVYIDTPFFSRDMSVVWIKNAKGNIKSYELNEIIPKDSKDFEIEYLKSQIEELKGMIKDVSNDTNVDTKQSTTNTTEYDESNGESVKEAKPTGIQKISRSKKE